LPGTPTLEPVISNPAMEARVMALAHKEHWPALAVLDRDERLARCAEAAWAAE
jgi:hypothetical protein